MATKTITITEDAYGLLAQNKLEQESFSEVLIRLLSRKRHKSLMDFFGILPREETQVMNQELSKLKEMNLQLLKKRLA